MKHRIEDRRRKHIPHDVRRQLIARDGFRCAFVSDQGMRCEACAFLQIHHRHAWAHGGSDVTDNLELLCHAHNRLFAERDFGRTHIDEAIADRHRDGSEEPRDSG